VEQEGGDPAVEGKGDIEIADKAGEGTSDRQTKQTGQGLDHELSEDEVDGVIPAEQEDRLDG